MFEKKIFTVEGDESVHLAAHEKTAAGRAGVRVDDGTLELLLDRNDGEFLGWITLHVRREHRPREMPVFFSTLVLFAISERGVDVIEDGGDNGVLIHVPTTVPSLECAVHHGAEILCLAFIECLKPANEAQVVVLAAQFECFKAAACNWCQILWVKHLSTSFTRG